MQPRWVGLDVQERLAMQVLSAFLLPRLGDREAVDWAVRLEPHEKAKRASVLALVDRESRKIAEPWRSAWRLIEESWASGTVNERNTTDGYEAKKRLKEGDRSGALVRLITELVAPRLKLDTRSGSKKRPRTVHDLLSVRVTSGVYVESGTLGIQTITEPGFLLSLARSLEAALSHGLEYARQTGWNGEGFPWQIGSLKRVYHVSGGGEQDPDKYHRGIAPSVKLLHEVVQRLAALQPDLADEFIRRWRTSSSPVYLRLWAAMARNPKLVSADDVSRFLLELSDEEFWDLHNFPEFAELRGRRFADLGAASQEILAKRIRRLPPRRLWRRKTPRGDLDGFRRTRAVVELRRIQTAGGVLAKSHMDWLATEKQSFPEMPDSVAPDYAYSTGAGARWVGASPDRRYDEVSGVDRLRALEAALSTTRRSWDDDPAQRAFDWLRESNNAFKVVADLGSARDGGGEFKNIWKMLGATHSYPQGQDSSGRNLADEAQQMLALLAKLPDDAARHSIDGITQWLANWKPYFTPSMAGLWLRFWPMAVAATNTRSVEDGAQPPTASPTKAEENESRVETDTLNTPAGQLVGVFLSVCPEVKAGEHPVESNTDLREMRDAIANSSGQARLIALHRLIEHLNYFLLADQKWAQKHLVEPLNANDPQAIALWHAIARETRFREEIEPIGEAMAQRASDPKLGRETRQSLTFSVVVECLHALREGRTPAVPFYQVQQMLRSVDDETRVHAAYAVQRFISDVANDDATAEELLQKAVAPFLHEVWPQERSLVTPGVSQAFSSVPAIALGAFSEAVSAIERFLVPFEAWTLYEYGLDSDGGPESRLLRIDNPNKAAALLRLIDLTVGELEGSVIPNDLGTALEQIRIVAPKLENDRAFRRLSVAARRA